MNEQTSGQHPAALEPDDVARHIEDATKPIGETLNKLANNPLGSESGRNQAGHNKDKVDELETQCQNILNTYNLSKTQSATNSIGPRPGGSSSNTRGNDEK